MCNSKNSYKTRSKSKFLLFCHLIFVVKYRRPLLNTYGGQVKTKIMELSGKKWRVEQMEVDVTHIHLLIEYDPDISISNIVRAIKSQTTYDLWETNRDSLSKEFLKQNTFWSPSYFACSIGNVSKETIEKYIQNQG